jgi:hypothetical protein
MIRQYNSTYRKKLKNKIKKIINQNDLKNIYSVVVGDIGIEKISINASGVYFNLNILSDNAVDEINNIICPCSI